MSEDKSLTELVRVFEQKIEQMEDLNESVTDKISELHALEDNFGFGRFSDENTQDLAVLQDFIPKLRDMASTNPLFVRGAWLRFSYVFGRGIEFQNLKPKTKSIIERLDNKSALFSVEAYERNNIASFTDGNFQVIRNEKTNELYIVPFHKVCGATYDRMDKSRLQYILIDFEVDDNKTEKRWVPLARYKKFLKETKKQLPRSIKAGGSQEYPVSRDLVIYHKASHRQPGWSWGIPDSLAAYIWTHAYTNYLTDNSQLVKALSQIAWAITSGTKKGIERAAAQVVGENGIGKTAINTPDGNISNVGVPSAQVSFNNGQPLAAQVASVFQVPVIALISSPGATGGSYGAATTLDLPTLIGMRALQDSWVVFYEEILRDLGSPNVTVIFPPIEEDPAYRQISSVALLHEMGVLHRDEIRDFAFKTTSLTKNHDNLPKQETEDKRAIVSKQGVQGAVKGGQLQGDTNHENDM